MSQAHQVMNQFVSVRYLLTYLGLPALEDVIPTFGQSTGSGISTYERRSKMKWNQIFDDGSAREKVILQLQ